MSDETEVINEAPEESPAPESEPDNPISIEFIEDGTSFIRETNAAPPIPLTEVVVQGNGWRIRKVGGHEIAQIFTGQFRENKTEGKLSKEFDAIATADKMLCMTVCNCVVKSSGEPLWLYSQVLTMWTDKKNGPRYIDLIRGLYQECIKVNPTLLPQQNEMAMKMMFGWF